MITPRTTRLVRVPDLRGMQAAVVRRLARAADRATQAVVVPTRHAAEALRRTAEDVARSAGTAALVFPDVVTRGDFYDRLAERLPDAPAPLSALEREVMLRRAARTSASTVAPAPFELRPGLVVEILDFYDELRRRGRTLDDFERLMTSVLEPSADSDRGAERMLRQTRFLAAALAGFEGLVNASGRIDEHGLRTLLAGRACEPAYRHVVITVADQAADAHGLWPADFDLLARLPGLERIEIIATEAVLASGFLERVHAALPGIEEVREGVASPAPVLVAPPVQPGEDAPPWFVCRDREAELVEIARALAVAPGVDAANAAVVFQRPLPYLYLARQVFADAQLPYQALDSLPLAAEPFVAALDLVFTFVLAEATRSSLVALLRSPHWSFADAGEPVTGSDAAAADDFLLEQKYHGGFDQLAAIAADVGACAASPSGRRRLSAPRERAGRAIRAAHAAATELRTVFDAPSAAAQILGLVRFVREHETLPARGDAWYARHMRARAAVLAALETLGDAHEQHDDQPLSVADLTATVRRWVEGQTFSPATGSEGVRLLDVTAAAYATVADLRIVGLAATDWPERSRRSIFYPASLLSQLGWPSEAERLAAARAHFQDLLTLPSRRLSVSTFTLEDDAIVPPSTFLEEIDAAGLSAERLPPAPNVRVFVHEALAEDPVVAAAVEGEAAEWLALRLSRSPATDAAFRGAAGERALASVAVSSVERYLECPFKYFAAHVLRLPEELDEESGLTPQERGQFLHEVFHDFFAAWHESGRRAITTANVRDALELFERVTEAKLLALSEADRALERTHLLGSAVAPGLAERAFAFEIEQGGEILERLLEYELQGRFEFRGPDAVRAVMVRAKADRIDLMSDGTLRVIDYKLSRAPKASRALQLPVYGVCAEQHLRGRHGRDWTLAQAGYVAFKEKHAFVPLGHSTPLAQALADGQARFLAAIAAIEAGTFPVDPDEPYRCQWCAYPSVCRKDYVGDE